MKTFASLCTFLLAMVLYPNVFKKAQKEIDDVVGNERLPDFDDRKSLPYLECVIKELYRWVHLNCTSFHSNCKHDGTITDGWHLLY